MVDALTVHDTRWVSPTPLWSEINDTSSSVARETFRRPAILRFDNDNFMDELLSLMEYYPERLVEWLAQPETWREPMPKPKTATKLTPAEPLSQFKQTQTRLFKNLSNELLVTKISSSVSIVPTADKPLKLYQPAQQRFYLVTASLVCRSVGLPDRVVDLAKQQKVEFVLRRLLPRSSTNAATPDICNPDECDEYAFIIGENGNRWQKVVSGSVTSDKELLDAEERLPMFNLGYDETEDKRRRMLAGFIPVGKREVYVNAGLNEIPVEDDETVDNTESSLSSEKRDAIVHLFSMQVGGPWKNVISLTFDQSNNDTSWDYGGVEPALIQDVPGGKPAEPNADNIKQTREKIQTTSWYIQVDLLQFLKDYIPNVHSYIKNSIAPAGISQSELALYDALESISIDPVQFGDTFITEVNAAYSPDPVLKTTLVSALKHLIDNPEIEIHLDRLDYPYDRSDEKTSEEYSWPDYLFPLADPVHDHALPSPLLKVTDPSDGEPDTFHDQIDELTKLIAAAIPLDLNRSAPDVNPVKLSKADRRDGWFVIRCAYETPNCGPFQLPVVSDSTLPFKLASFFDPDAPGRPITIPMPLDISPAGLRKYNKNASFMISDMLCGKLSKIRKLTLGDLVLSVLPWPFHKDLPDPGDTGTCSKGGTGFGMICSLSIPIVTLCAMILLIIMVTLFDIFFRWLPLLFLCLPVPGLKGKKNA